MTSTKQRAKYYGIDLTGSTEDCEDCALGKARQKNVGKGNEEKQATIQSYRLFFDISSIKNTSFGGANFWLLIVDDATDQSLSYSLKKKSDTAQTIVNLIKHLKEKERIEVKMLRCDNT
jgi:hypothetical protein